MRSITTAAVILFCLVLCSCQRRFIYAPAKVNTPMLRQKGDARLNTSLSFGNAKGLGDSSKNVGLDVQGAYAVSPHVAVMLSYYNRREEDIFGPFNRVGEPFNFSYVNYHRHSWEGGAGYFNTAPSSSVTFSVYGGAAFGRLQISDVGFLNDSNSYNRYFNSPYSKFFLQPGLTAGKWGRTRIDLSLRASFLHYGDISTDYTSVELDNFRLNKLDNTTLIFFEPSLTLQAPVPGSKWLNIEASTSSIFHSLNRSVRGWNFSIGITADPLKLIMR